jgi:hypothetical protein
VKLTCIYVKNAWSFTSTAAIFIHAPKKLKKLRGFGLQANYVDRATAACWRLLPLRLIN